ncbi:MAG: hypothetical protein R2705_06580 [Ilumatobacteraceae bacterium]
MLVLATAWSVFGPGASSTRRPRSLLLAPLLAVGTFGFTRASDGFDLLVTPATFVHVIAFAAWFGGLALLWRVTLAGSREGPGRRGPATSARSRIPPSSPSPSRACCCS